MTLSYNQGRFLREAIESVRIGPPHELVYVIVDPGSNDGSREIIEANRSRFSKIIFEPDQGPADGLNKGFAACDADVFGYVNSDDRLEPGALDWVADYFSVRSDVDVLQGCCRVLDEGGRARLRKIVPTRFSLRSVLRGTQITPQQATFFRRRAFLASGGFNVKNTSCWDGELLVDMALRGCRFATVPRVLGQFRIHACSLTGSGCRNAVYREDSARIARRLVESGYAPEPETFVRFIRAANWLNPFRRLMQVLPLR